MIKYMSTSAIEYSVLGVNPSMAKVTRYGGKVQSPYPNTPPCRFPWTRYSSPPVYPCPYCLAYRRNLNSNDGSIRRPIHGSDWRGQS